jgi:rubrerythrin
MTESNERITKGLLRAIQAESDGENFYRMAAASTDDEQGKATFLRLAEEEREHIEFLTHQYNHYLETGKPDPNKVLSKPSSFEGSHPIFSEKLKSRIGDAHMEMSALSIGIQLELNAINFYKTQATEIENQEVKKFFRELVDWETGHYHALLRQQESLKEDYWSSAGFSPF